MFDRWPDVQMIECSADPPLYEAFVKILVSSTNQNKVKAAAGCLLRKYEVLSDYHAVPDMALDMTIVHMRWRIRRGCGLQRIGDAVVWWFGEELHQGHVGCAGLAYFDRYGVYPSKLIHPKGSEAPAGIERIRGYGDAWYELMAEAVDDIANDVLVLL